MNMSHLLRKCSQSEGKECNSTDSEITVPMSRLRYDRSRRVETRFIPTTPFRILDAPGIINDYYLNLLDWHKETVTIALKDTLYAYSVETKEVNELLSCSGNNSSYISAIKAFDGKICVGDSLGGIKVFDMGVQKVVGECSMHTTRVCSISFNGTVISSGDKGGKIFNSDPRCRKPVAVFEGHSQEVCGLKWRPTVKALDWCKWKSNILCTGGGSKDKSIRLWDVIGGKEVKRVETDSQVCTLNYLSKYKELLTAHGFQQNDLKLWRATGGIKLIKSFGSHDSRILHTAVSPDECTLASLGADESLKFWKIGENTKEEVKRDSLSIR
ncbi:APCC activator protein CDH1 [Nucleospora cyclopteri]